ncbi:MAG: hypothetical protein SFW67_28505 [Myxococcaceae bacterium]|nr:hypothetical protein [Myxococcaceae bacterium]
MNERDHERIAKAIHDYFAHEVAMLVCLARRDAMDADKLRAVVGETLKERDEALELLALLMKP